MMLLPWIHYLVANCYSYSLIRSIITNPFDYGIREDISTALNHSRSK